MAHKLFLTKEGTFHNWDCFIIVFRSNHVKNYLIQTFKIRKYRIPKSEQFCLRIYQRKWAENMFGRFKVTTVSLSRNLFFIESVIKIGWNVKDKRSMKEP